MPAAWPDVFPELTADPDRQVRSRAMALGVTFGDATARGSASAGSCRWQGPPCPAARSPRGFASGEGPLARRPRCTRWYATPASAVSRFAGSRPTTIRRRRTFDRRIRSLGPTERRDALNTLAARKGSAQALLAAVGGGQAAPRRPDGRPGAPASQPQGPGLDAQISQVWGTVRETTGDRARLSPSTRRCSLKARHAPDPRRGGPSSPRSASSATRSFGVGRQVGPDLTGSNRADLDYLLSNVLDPSALIGKDYLAHVIATTTAAC